MDVLDSYNSAQEVKKTPFEGLSPTHLCVPKSTLTKTQSATVSVNELPASLEFTPRPWYLFC